MRSLCRKWVASKSKPCPFISPYISSIHMRTFVHLDQAPVARTIGDQVPGLILAFFPVQDQPKPASVVLDRQPYPSHVAGLAFRQGEGVDLPPAVVLMVDFDRPLLPDGETPAPSLKPAQQRYMLKLRIAHHPDLSIPGEQPGDLSKQSQLGFHWRVAPFSLVNAPGQRQGAFAVRHPDD